MVAMEKLLLEELMDALVEACRGVRHVQVEVYGQEVPQ